jgi:HAD superfamily hydrolase (TIGR01549 family)
VADVPPLRAILFDYGNTLVPFHAPHLAACDDALAATLRAFYGDFDHDALAALRKRDRVAPYLDRELREHDLARILRETVRELFGRAASIDEVAALIEARRRAFVAIVRPEPEAAATVARLARRFRLGLVSNYPCAPSIRDSLESNGLGVHFSAVVVSADVGRVKPHALPFETALTALGVTAAEAMYVGDNWLADVQGARRAGLRAVWMRRWDRAEAFEPGAGDLPPEATIDDLEQLEALVERAWPQAKRAGRRSRP